MSMPYLTTVFARRHVLEGDLVADRDVLARLEGDRPVVVHDPAGHRRAGGDALDDDHGHRVGGVVQYAMDQSGLLVQLPAMLADLSHAPAPRRGQRLP